MITYLYKMRVFSCENADFRTVTNSNVLIYWPHGLGDLVMLSYVLPLLNPTNRYAVTSLSDSYLTLQEGNRFASPVYSGMSTQVPHTVSPLGSDLETPHFGITQMDGGYSELHLPASLYFYCVQNDVDVLLWPGFPEVVGRVEYPYHSKPRYVIPFLTRQELLATNISRPLLPSINFDVAPWILRYIESVLQSRCGFGSRKLCIIGRTGFSAFDKNWGHLWRAADEEGGPFVEGEECRDFMRLLLRTDPNWMFLSMEHTTFSGHNTVADPALHAYSYSELFGASSGDSASLPYGMIMKVLGRLAELFVGVPSGPYCVSMANLDLPTIGIWLTHFPSWYCEPKSNAIDVISRNVFDMKLHTRPGSFLKRDHLIYRSMGVATRRVMGEHILTAAEELLS